MFSSKDGGGGRNPGRFRTKAFATPACHKSKNAITDWCRLFWVVVVVFLM